MRFTSDNEDKYIITHVHISPEHVVATDGHRMLIVEHHFDVEGSFNLRVTKQLRQQFRPSAKQRRDGDLCTLDTESCTLEFAGMHCDVDITPDGEPTTYVSYRQVLPSTVDKGRQGDISWDIHYLADLAAITSKDRKCVDICYSEDIGPSVITGHLLCLLTYRYVLMPCRA
jgi:hypothetical protein